MVIIAVALIIGTVFFFQGWRTGAQTYPITVRFSDAGSVIKGASVTLAGVEIGKVDSIKLDKSTLQAAVHIKVNDDQHIPIGSRFVIVTPVLGTAGILTVVPPPDAAQHPGASLPSGWVGQGESPQDLQTSLQSASKLMDQLQTTIGKVNVLLDRTTNVIGGPQIQRTLGNVEASSKNINLLIAQLSTVLNEDNAQVQKLLAQTQAGAQQSIGNLTAATADVKGMTAENRQNISEIVENLRDTTAAVQGLTSQANGLLGPEGGVAKNVSATMANVNTMTTNLAATTARLDKITANVEKLSSDNQVQSDLKQTVHNIKETTDQTTVLVGRLNRLLGVKPKPAAIVVAPGGAGAVLVAPGTTPSVATQDVPKTAGPAYLPRVDFIQNTRSDHFRMDIDGLLPFGFTPNGFFRAGVYGVADDSRFNFQYGTLVNKKSGLAYRAGLYKSKLSVGADYGLGSKFSINADLYDPNKARADVHGVYMLNNSFGVVLGSEDILKHQGAVVGVEFRR